MMDPHSAVAPTLAFLKDYYSQIDRLLSDMTHRLLEADPPWQRLRRLGDTYETECEIKVGQPERFLVRYLGHWYAPAASFPGHGTYGADHAGVPRLAFAGVWLGDDRNVPELYAGWITGMTWVPEKVVETQIKQFNDWIDPDESTPPHELTPLDAAEFEERPFRLEDTGARLAMARVPLADIDGPAALRQFMNRWLIALATPSS